VQADSAYELVDFGGGARLERLGDRLVDRPHPAALGDRRSPTRWLDADLRFERDRGWTGRGADAEPWTLAIEGLTIELRTTSAGQVGLFPEHLAMAGWLQGRVAERLVRGSSAPQPAVVNLFAYTGLATLLLAASGAAVTHVDSARPTVAWAKRNAELSGLGDRPIRWIVDDAVAFARREARRGRRYAGAVLDPPSYGHGPGGRPWRLEDDLGTLVDAVTAILEPAGFLLLTAHTPGFDGDRLAEALGPAARRSSGAITNGDLCLTTHDGRTLELGAFARTPGGA
jgi:23S rRNA (cytosine1962-C5)-methyltransferase